MKKRIIAIILMCTCFVGVGMSTPVYVSAESNETVSYTTQDLCTCIDKIDKMESIMNKIDKEYEKASNDGDKFKCKNCIVEYSLVTDALVNYAEKYYSRDLVKQIQEGQNKLTAKLKEVEDKVTKVYWENGGGSGAALDIPRMQCEVYKSRCYELINIYKQNKDKADESEITTCDKKLYDDKTKTGFKYVGNNECVYYDNGRMLIHEWKEFDDGYRYFNKNGLMAHDITIDGYYLNSSGAWVGSSSVNMGDKILGRWYGLYMDRSVPDSITKNTICGNVYNIVEDRGDSLIIDVYYNDGTSDRHMIHYIDENTMTMYLYNNYTKIYT